MDEKKVIAKFNPQEWYGNHAIDVEPEGAVEFDVTTEIERMGRDEALLLKDNSDESDMLAKSDSAPGWIRNWSGPFYVNVQRSVHAYFGPGAS